ncbi:MAG: TonB-dependent receptor domain-containing protein, partial [Ignavibacteriales bacterium]
GHNYFLSKNPYNLMSYALFGEAFYKIKENLKLTAGLRWTVDQKQAPLIPSQLLVPNSTGYPVLGVTKQEWREPTGRLAIDWKPDLSISDETLIYASYAHGYKAGGANPPPAAVVCYACANDQGVLAQHSPVHPATFDPEFVNAFEVGSKNTLLDGSITLNGDAFYYDYKDYQISQIVDRSAINMNFDARVWGVELEADWHPLENLRVGFKGGYENARVADGMRAIDVMDRTAGNPDWVAARPFPTYTSNCVLPVWLFIGNWPDWLSTANPDPVNVGGVSGGNPSGCEEAYVFGRDPATKMPYVPDPYGPNGLPASQLRLGEEFRTGIDYAAWSTDPAHYPCWPSGVQIGTLSYPGVDPQCLAALSNNGAGFFKDLGGNELPNAPHFTATVSADYTLPLPSDWLMTLHGDFYYQSEAWARIFNTPGYDKLKAYTNVNLAAIFSNEDAGWKIMAYVKNVFDRDSITGAFLNSDDTGLTTNVFLTEPRLYGLRVTKEWTGGPWWTGANPNHTGPYAFTVELGGEVQRQKAAYETLAPALFSDFPSELDTTTSQHRRMDRGDGREVRLTYQPDGSPWMVAAAYRYGRVNTETTRVHSEIETAKVCGLPTTGPFGPAGRSACDPTSPKYTSTWVKAPQSWSDSEAHSREEHTVVDFAVARDVGLGRFKSMLGVGVRYAQLKAETFADMSAVPYEYIPDGWRWKYMHHTRYEGSVNAHREFTGEGPVVNWDGSAPFLGNDNTGHLNIDGSVSAGVLFGKQKVAIEGAGMSRYYKLRTFPKKIANGDPQYVDLGEAPRSTSASVPVVDLSLGLSYDIQRIKLSTGYRWERYFNAIDGGYAEHKSYDRTIDGPYFKIAVGFGG